MAARSFSDFQSIEKLILSAAKALDVTAEIPGKKGTPVALGVFIGAAVGFCAGAGMVAVSIDAGRQGLSLQAFADLGASSGSMGLGVVMAGFPAIIGGVIGAWAMAYINKKRLVEAESRLLQEISRLHEVLLTELQNRREKETGGSDDAYLFSLATKLRTVGWNLKTDLTQQGYSVASGNLNKPLPPA